jgi:UDP-N-acetylglucosamine 2-epimerase (non-hydrolysing)
LAEIMIRFEELLKNHKANVVIVVGDVTSTLACAIVTKKLHKTLIHIEAGLRSIDRNMPEEINRIVTDSISDYFFTTSLYAKNNLLKEGIKEDYIYFVGNIMIDSLIRQLDHMEKPTIYDTLSLIEKEYYLLTLHRAENVDNDVKLKEILITISESIDNRKCIFPVHPRTERILRNTSLSELTNIECIAPLRYAEFLYVQKNAKAVITDSGGIQEETTFMNVPCITFRTTTERPETVEIGSNELAKNFADLSSLIKKTQLSNWKKTNIPDLWDGQTADRIVNKLKEIYSL